MRTIEVKGHSSAYMRKAVFYLHMLLQYPLKECHSHSNCRQRLKYHLGFSVISFSESKIQDGYQFNQCHHFLDYLTVPLRIKIEQTQFETIFQYYQKQTLSLLQKETRNTYL